MKMCLMMMVMMDLALYVPAPTIEPLLSVPEGTAPPAELHNASGPEPSTTCWYGASNLMHAPLRVPLYLLEPNSSRHSTVTICHNRTAVYACRSDAKSGLQALLAQLSI